jgi:hypothetical protein
LGTSCLTLNNTVLYSSSECSQWITNVFLAYSFNFIYLKFSYSVIYINSPPENLSHKPNYKGIFGLEFKSLTVKCFSDLQGNKIYSKKFHYISHIRLWTLKIVLSPVRRILFEWFGFASWMSFLSLHLGLPNWHLYFFLCACIYRLQYR